MWVLPGHYGFETAKPDRTMISCTASAPGKVPLVPEKKVLMEQNNNLAL